jgi:cellulose synthase/poly-beta-1,6-N-acetylglucosamine synthase-like glycosyltransferase
MFSTQQWIEFTVWGFLGLTCLIQLYYHLIEFSGVGFAKKEDKGNGKMNPVSVIVCARNELKNLRNYLPDLMNQDYPEYQVVVVNDCSWDESGKYLDEMADAFPNLKVITIVEQEKYQHGKKFAVSLGIKGAKYEQLLFIDADCKPYGVNWIKNMMNSYTDNKEIVVSYGAYMREKGLLNKWIRFDTAQNGLIFLSRALKGKAYMGVGRNLSYKKDLFFRNKGFAKHYHVQSGDDDLLINETATDKNVAVNLEQEGFTYSKPEQSWLKWVHQKRRHMTTGAHYKNRDKRLLSLYFSSLILFWISVVVALILKLKLEYIVAMVVTRLIVQLFVYWKGFKKLGETDLIPFVPFFDFFIAFTYPVLAFTNLIVKPKNWK